MRALKVWGVLLGLAVVSAPAATSKVYVRWTQNKVPPPKILGTTDLVVPWSEPAQGIAAAARKQGYQVYLQAAPEQAVAAADAAAKVHASGIVLEDSVTAAGANQAKDTARQIRQKYPKLKVLILSANGKQPEMRGWLVFSKNGILQVSSPTSQPWLDQNLANAEYDRAFESAQPPLYTFSWDQTDPLVKERGPQPGDYSLAVAEAGAFHADLLLQLHSRQQEGLAGGDPATLSDWEQVRRTMAFYDRDKNSALEAAAVGVFTDDYDAAYEPINLMARHNIPFRVLHSAAAKAADLANFSVIIEFSAPGKELTGAIQSFAEAGGVAVLVNAPGKYPWQSATASRNSEHSVTYTVGKGRVIELGEPVSDPETFAQDVRRLMPKEQIPVSLWNSLTTLVVEYPGTKAGEAMVELVNYDQERTQVQVQVKGAYESIEFESPDGGCCETLKPSHVDGFTDFVVPNLVIGGRVYLQSKASSQSKN